MLFLFCICVCGNKTKKKSLMDAYTLQLPVGPQSFKSSLGLTQHIRYGKVIPVFNYAIKHHAMKAYKGVEV
jgi:hypothetical protein